MLDPAQNRLNIKGLNYAIAQTHSNDHFIVIEHNEYRHPITDISIDEENKRVSWVNASGTVEILGLEVPLSDEVMEQITKDEIFVSEGDLKKGLMGKHVWILSGLTQEELERRDQEQGGFGVSQFSSPSAN